MAKHLEKFTKPFQESRIPFLLTEVITDGEGNMVDLVCRFANAPAAALLGDTPQALRGRRFTRVYPPERLETLAPWPRWPFPGPVPALPTRPRRERPCRWCAIRSCTAWPAACWRPGRAP